MKSNRKVISILWAVLGVPALFGIFVQGTYKYSLQQGSLPYRVLPEWIWYTTFVLCLFSGTFLIYQIPFKRPIFKNTTLAVYIGLMSLALMGIHLYFACSNGDCL